jgi:hypothetical protein
MWLHTSSLGRALVDDRLRAAARRRDSRDPRAAGPLRRRTAAIGLAVVRRLDPSLGRAALRRPLRTSGC